MVIKLDELKKQREKLQKQTTASTASPKLKATPTTEAGQNPDKYITLPTYAKNEAVKAKINQTKSPFSSVTTNRAANVAGYGKAVQNKQANLQPIRVSENVKAMAQAYNQNPNYKDVLNMTPTQLNTWFTFNAKRYKTMPKPIQNYIDAVLLQERSTEAADSKINARTMAALQGYRGGMTLGLDSLVNKSNERKQFEQDINAAYPVANLAGKMAGYTVNSAAPDALLLKAAGKFAGQGVAKKALSTGLALGTSNTAQGLVEDTVTGKSGKQIAANAGLNFALGGALGTLGNLAAAQKGIVLPKNGEMLGQQAKTVSRNILPSDGINTKTVITPKTIPTQAKADISTPTQAVTTAPNKTELAYPPTNRFNNTKTVEGAGMEGNAAVKNNANISRFRTNTLERSQPQEALKELTLEDFDFIPETKAEWQEQAVQNIQQNRNKVIADIKEGKSISGGVQAHEAAIITHDLRLEAEKTGDYSEYKAFLQTVAEKTREAARALKGTDTAWDKISPDGAVLQAQRVVNKVEENLKTSDPALIKKIDTETKAKIKELTDLGENPNYNEVRDIVKKKYNVATLDDADIETIITNMEKASKELDGSYAQRQLRAEVLNMIANKVPSDGVEKMQALQRISMLLNPKTTAVRNPLGNTVLGILEDIKNIPATGLDKAISLKTHKRTTTINPLVKGKANIQGFAQGAAEWGKDIKYGINTSPTGAKYEMPKKTIIFSENHNIANPTAKKIADTTGKIGNETHKAVGYLLQIGDRPFYQGAYNSRIAELKLLNKTDEITDEMKMLANEFALERTLQNESWASSLFAGLKDPATLKKFPGSRLVYRVMASLILPFAQTPANILDKFIDYSGVGGIVKATAHAASKGEFKQKYFVDTMSRGLTGMGLITLGSLLAEKGLATAGYSGDKKVESFETALGKSNFAFKIGDTYQTFDWALPAAAPIALGVSFYEAKNSAKSGQNATLKGLESAINVLFDSTLLQGISGLMSGYSPALSIGKTLLGSTTQVTPTLGKQIAQLIDPYTRETYDPNTMKQVLNKTVARIPLASKTLPARQDVFGQDVKAYQGKNNIFNVMFNPGFSTEYNPTFAQKEMERLYEKTGSKSVLPDVAPKKLTIDGEKINLTAEQYNQYAKTQGQTSYGIIQDAVRSNEYKQLDDTAKAKVIEHAYDYASDYAKKRVLPNYEMKGWKAEAFEADKKGVDVDDYVLVYLKMLDTKSDKNKNGETIKLSASKKKKDVIDNLPNLNKEQRKMLYEMFDISEKVW